MTLTSVLWWGGGSESLTGVGSSDKGRTRSRHSECDNFLKKIIISGEGGGNASIARRGYACGPKRLRSLFVFWFLFLRWEYL